MKQAGRIFRQALLLTAVTLFSRTAGVSFSVYISNRVGAEAMGLYSLLSGVFTFALTLATSGIYLGTTRVVAEAIGEGKPGEVRFVMRRCVLYAVGFSFTSAILLYIFAEPIGRVWLSDVRTVASLRLLALSLPLLSLSTVFSGYFTAVRRVTKNTVAQIFDDALRIGGTCFLLFSLSDGGVEAACLSLVLGGVIADLGAFLVNFVLYLTDRRRHLPADPSVSRKQIAGKLLGITLPVAFSAYIRSGLVTLEHILIPSGLTRFGASRAEALAEYGIIHSMVLPVVLFPAALIACFSGLLVPEMSEARVKGEKRHEGYIISRVFTFSMLFSVGVGGILCCFAGEIGGLLYPGTPAAHYIRILAPLIPVMYVDTATDALLKGMSEQVFCMNVNIADALISVLIVWILVPRCGIRGYLITIFVSECFNTSLSLARLMKISGYLPSFTKNLLKPALSVLAAAWLARLVFSLPGISANGAFDAVLHVGVAAIFYCGLLRLTGAVNKEEAHWIRTVLRWKIKTPPGQNGRTDDKDLITE